MKTLFELILLVLKETLAFLKKQQAKKVEKTYQVEADHAKEDVVGAFNKHFSSKLPDDSASNGAETKTNKT